MPSGTNFNLTDKRIDTVRKLFGKQRGLHYVAMKLGCNPDHLSTMIKAAGLDVKQMKLDGINTLKGDVYEAIADITEPKDKFKAGLDFLKHYDCSDDVASKTQVLEVKTTKQGIGDLYKDMNGED